MGRLRAPGSARNRSLLLVCLLVAACVRFDTDHCGNRDGDASCAARDPSRPYCSVCEVVNDGCVGEAPADACVVDSSAAGSSEGVGSSGTTDDGASETSVGASSAGDAASSSATTLDTGASESTTSSESSGGTPVCGDGVLEGDEVCDGDDLGGLTCELLQLDGGMLGCLRDCLSFDLTGCEGVSQCGNLILEGNEACDGVNLGGHTCLELPGFGGGTLQCDECMLNTTGCTACKPALAACGDPAECCSGGCTLGLCL
jgi:hypothetical protein